MVKFLLGGYFIILIFTGLFSHSIVGGLFFPETQQFVLRPYSKTYQSIVGKGRYLYLRANFLMPEAGGRWGVSVVAEGEARVMCNGKFVGVTEEGNESLSAGVFDLTKYLKVGKNVLALRVTKLQTIGNDDAKVWVGSWYSDHKGVLDEGFGSKVVWKFTNSFPVSKIKGGEWYSPDYIDYHWQDAGRYEKCLRSVLLPVNPHLLMYPFHGHYVSPNCTQLERMTFTRTVALETKVASAFLRMVVSSPMKVSVNGYSLGEVKGDSKRVQCINITRYLEHGENTITLTPFSRKKIPEFYVDGVFFSRAGQVSKVLQSDTDWEATEGTCMSLTTSRKVSNIVFPIEINKAAASSLTKARIAIVRVSIFLLVLAVVYFEIRWVRKKICMRKEKKGEWEAVFAVANSYGIPGIILACCYLAARDSRVPDSLPFLLPTLIVISLVIVCIKIPLYFEIMRRNE